MNRREFLYGTTALTLPVLAGCDNSDEPVASIDLNYPVSPFGAKSTAEEVTLGLDLTGKTAVVTGCNSGLGYDCLLYTSPSPRDRQKSRMPSSA